VARKLLGAVSAERKQLIISVSVALRVGDLMGNVLMIIRVMPKGLEVDLDVLKEGVKKVLKGVAQQMALKEQPIAFGLKAVEVSVVVPEDKGSFVEEVLAKINGVQTVIVQSVSLV
jgi:elongation factor 1-beta